MYVHNMPIITACKFLNHLNKTGIEEFAIGTQWNDLKIKVLIIRDNNTILIGEIFLEEFNKYARTFEKTLKDYLKETEDILNGKNDEVQFFLEDHKFYWKKKKWYLGQINIKLSNEFECLKNFTILLIDQFSKLKNCVIELHKNNENLKNNNSKLTNKLNEMVLLKNELEKKLYKKFILLINTKKAKIRELKNKLEKLEKKDSIYDIITDESDNEFNSLNNFTSHPNLIEKSLKKRLVNEDGEKLNEKRQKFKNTLKSVVIADKSTIQSVNVNIKSIVSKNMLLIHDLGEDEETPDLLSDESECDVELKFEEEDFEDECKNKISTTQEDSEEEMF